MGNNILKGKKGIIFGALDSSSIAWKTAESIYNEGGELILTNAPVIPPSVTPTVTNAS